MTKTAIVAEQLPPPVGPFSPAIRTEGFIFVSGQVGVDPRTAKLVAGGVAEETEQLCANLACVLAAAGKDFTAVVRSGLYLTNMADFAVVNRIYAKWFTEPYPARTTIGVAALPMGAAVEIDLVVKD